MLLVFIFIIIFIVLIITIEFKLYICIEDKYSKIILKIFTLKKIPIAKIRLNKYKKSKRSNIKRKLKFKIRKILIGEGNIFKTIFKNIKHSNCKIEKLSLDMQISSSDAVLTSYLVFITSSVVTFFLKFFNKNINCENCNYKIIPLYVDKKILNINLDCIISINIVHIINMIYKNAKKRRCVKNGRGTSNRRSYGYCNEQYKTDDRRKYNYRRADKSSR